MRRLVLFDIDGTLLSTHAATARVFHQALREVYGTTGPVRGYSFGGKTDPQIARELLLAAGLQAADIEARLPALWAAYLPRLRAALPAAEITVFPGVERVLDALAAAPDAAVLGLLTGNLREGAWLKLQAARLGPERFRVGAFGSDHADRRELPALAVGRAAEAVGRRFAPREVVVIGDTPADIACGAHLGARTVAVATGTYSADALAEHEPDALLPSLADFDAAWAAIFAED